MHCAGSETQYEHAGHRRCLHCLHVQLGASLQQVAATALNDSRWLQRLLRSRTYGTAPSGRQGAAAAAADAGPERE